MDKRTLLAVILISLLFVLWAKMDPGFFGAKKEQEPPVSSVVNPSRETQQVAQEDKPALNLEEEVLSVPPRDIEMETDLFRVNFSTEGAIITSLRLKEHLDNGVPLEMVNTGGGGRGTLEVFLGKEGEIPFDGVFDYRKVDELEHEFTKSYFFRNSDGTKGPPFILKKTYRFFPNDYMFELRISFKNSVNDYILPDRRGVSYSLVYGPQIGPSFDGLKQDRDYRHYQAYMGGKVKNFKPKGSNWIESRDLLLWAALTGKYFLVAGIPGAVRYEVGWRAGESEGGQPRSEMRFSRPTIAGSQSQDLFRFYVGPKDTKLLAKYNKADQNPLKASDLHLDRLVRRGFFLGWLQLALKFFLALFYSLIPNYGVAIILTTLLIKVLLFPLTHKSFESTSKMQVLQPKIKEIQEKYKGNVSRINQEMAALYKRERVNPMGGCIPLLVQMPILIAFYGLLNNTFVLRNAVFIPGWINDLSSPESIWNFAPFQIPFLGWSDLRFLPILFFGAQFFVNKLMSPASLSANQSQTQTKMLTYGMPIVFFFIFYNMPSGLLLYWTVTTLVTAVQQVIVGKFMKRKKVTRAQA